MAAITTWASPCVTEATGAAGATSGATTGAATTKLLPRPRVPEGTVKTGTLLLPLLLLLLLLLLPPIPPFDFMPIALSSTAAVPTLDLPLNFEMTSGDTFLS